MSAFDRIKEQRERTAGLDWEDRQYAEEEWDPPAHEPDNPKSDGYYERMADLWDNRDKTAGLP